MICLRLFLPLVLLIAAGCTTTVIPPRNVDDPVPIYLTDYGRHSSILMPDPDAGGLVEYAFGDFEWFALNHNTSGHAIRSLLFSPASTLGRRHLDIDPDAPDAAAQIAHASGADTVQRFPVARDQTIALMNDLDDEMYKNRRTMTYNALSDVWFVRTPHTYRAWRNCNHVTGDWLKRLGCRIRGLSAFSRFDVRQ